jgi:hypothetical protein
LYMQKKKIILPHAAIWLAAFSTYSCWLDELPSAVVDGVYKCIKSTKECVLKKILIPGRQRLFTTYNMKKNYTKQMAM